MTKEQVKFVLKENKYHDIEVWKFLLKQVRNTCRTNDVDMLRKEIERFKNKLLNDVEALDEFTKAFNHKLLRKKLANFDSLNVEEKILLTYGLNKLNSKHKYILMQVLYVGRTQTDLADELNINRNVVSDIINTALDEIINEIREEL